MKTQAACHIWTGFACTGLWVLLLDILDRLIVLYVESFSEQWLWYVFELEDMYSMSAESYLLKKVTWLFLCLFLTCFVMAF